MDYAIKVVIAIIFAVCIAFVCVHICDRILYKKYICLTKVVPMGVVVIDSSAEIKNNEKITYVKNI